MPPAVNPGDKNRTATLSVHVKRAEQGNKLTVKVDGQVVPEPQAIEADEKDGGGNRLHFAVEDALFKNAENAVEAVGPEAPASAVQIDDVRLDFNYA